MHLFEERTWPPTIDIYYEQFPDCTSAAVSDDRIVGYVSCQNQPCVCLHAWILSNSHISGLPTRHLYVNTLTCRRNEQRSLLHLFLNDTTARIFINYFHRIINHIHLYIHEMNATRPPDRSLFGYHRMCTGHLVNK